MARAVSCVPAAAPTWSLLGAIAAKTSTLGLATGVTCPTVRYHPAIIAQAAATMALVSDGRFTLGVGAGERFNEHVVGQGFPSVRGRHDPVNFDAATSWVEDHHIRQQFSVGPDPEVHLAKIRTYVHAGYDHVVLQNAGPDPDGFLDFFAGELAGPLRALGRQPVAVG